MRSSQMVGWTTAFQNRLVNLMLVILVIGVAIHDIVHPIALQFNGLGEGTYRELNDVLKKSYQSGDLVYFFPLLPIEMLPLFTEAPVFYGLSPNTLLFEGASRIWWVSEDRNRPDHTSLSAYTINDYGSTGPFHVWLLEHQRPISRFGFRNHLDKAHVKFIKEGQEMVCGKWIRDRWECKGKGISSWHNAALKWQPIDGIHEPCIWAHPLTQGELHITYRDVVLGDEIRLIHALDDTVKKGDPVNIDILVNNKELKRIIQASTTGFKTESIQTADFRGKKGDVTLKITTRNDDGRKLCLQGGIYEE